MSTRTYHLLIESCAWLVLFVIASLFVYNSVRSRLAPSVYAGVTQVYPNAKLTPGKADTLSRFDLNKLYAGQTYSQAHRNVPESEKQAVLKEYGLQSGVGYEIDHFYPLCAGGSNDITNLWPQSGVGQWNFHDKDKFETFVCRGIKNGTILPAEAYDKMRRDWIAYYKELGLGTQSFGSVPSEDVDGDIVP